MKNQNINFTRSIAQTAMKEAGQNKLEEKPSTSLGETRRNFIKKPLVLAASSIVLPSFLGNLVAKAKADRNGNDVTIAPRYFSLNPFRPDIDLTGKLAVVTGASRGNGRAIGEALTALGVDVIGTSRDPASVPNPPAYPLLALDISDPGSVYAFVAALQGHPLFQQHGR